MSFRSPNGNFSTQSLGFSSSNSDKLNGLMKPIACLRPTDVAVSETTRPMF